MFSRPPAWAGRSVHRKFQSPPHRGTVFSRKISRPSRKMRAVSVPSSSGHGVQRLGDGWRLDQLCTVSVPSSSGHGVQQDLFCRRRDADSRFSPLLIGARCSAGPAGRFHRRSATFQSPPHRGTVFSQLLAVSKKGSVPRFSPLLIGARCSARGRSRISPAIAPCFSPLLIGARCSAIAESLILRVLNWFQSPPHRGTVFSARAGRPRLERSKVSVPSSSGHGVQLFFELVQGFDKSSFSPLLIGARCSAKPLQKCNRCRGTFQSPPHRGTVFSAGTSEKAARSDLFQSPPHRGTVFSSPSGFLRRREVQVSVPSSSGHGVQLGVCCQHGLAESNVSVPSSSGHGVQLVTSWLRLTLSY